MHVSTLVRWSAVLGVVGLALTGCSDNAPLAPSAQPKRFATNGEKEAWLLANGGTDRAGRGKADKTLQLSTKDFVVDPTKETTIRAGDHWVTFPANSICDPATSGYGEELWDAPCEPLQTPIVIRATWVSKYGHAHIEFQPALRFVPTNDPSRYVRLGMKDYDAFDPNVVYPILWQRPSDGKWVDESASDPSLGTLKDEGANDRVSRRLKHFSGYMIMGAESCDAWSELSCLPLSEFAGWMVLGG